MNYLFKETFRSTNKFHTIGFIQIFLVQCDSLFQLTQYHQGITFDGKITTVVRMNSDLFRSASAGQSVDRLISSKYMWKPLFLQSRMGNGNRMPIESRIDSMVYALTMQLDVDEASLQKITATIGVNLLAGPLFRNIRDAPYIVNCCY